MTKNNQPFAIGPRRYRISIMDDTGQVINTIEATRFAIIGEADSRFTKTFSSSNLIDQLGLLNFALHDVEFEKTVIKSREGNQNANA